MSQAYEREQQNNNRLDELASKVSALRGVTIDIYDNARDQHVIDSTVRLQTSFLQPHSLQPQLFPPKKVYTYTNIAPPQTETFSSFSSTLKGSATRLTRMAQSGNKVAILKLSGIIIATVVVLYWIWHLMF
jgi:blocked-early-in-transport protein 1